MSTTQPNRADLIDPDLPEFEGPPPAPMELLNRWFHDATTHRVVEPHALALATVDHGGRPSNRIVRVLHTTARGLVFTSHSGSQKGRDIAETGRVSGVHYWRELGRQIIVSGTAHMLPDDESDALWLDRPPGTRPMSVATRQSAVLCDQHKLLARARELTEIGRPLPRPRTWVGYELTAESIEFWHVGVERLHRRLRYDSAGSRWSSTLLQP